MKLLTKELRQKLPSLYTNENKKPEDVQIIVKFFHPLSGWAWYATEGQFDFEVLVCYNNDGRNFQKREGISDEEKKILCNLWEKNNKTLPFSCGENDLWNFMQKSIYSKDQKEKGFSGKEKSNVDRRNQNNRWLCSNLFAKSSKSKKELCQESRFSDGESIRKIPFGIGDNSPQKRKKDRRQTREFTSDVQRETPNTSYKIKEGERKLQGLPQKSKKKYQRKIYKINDFTFFGYVRGFENELGYFTLSELQSVRIRGLGIERDMYFGKHTLAEAMAKRL